MAADVKIGEIFQLKRTEGIWVLYIKRNSGRAQAAEVVLGLDNPVQ
jgi:hypothetical protein